MDDRCGFIHTVLANGHLLHEALLLTDKRLPRDGLLLTALAAL